MIDSQTVAKHTTQTVHHLYGKRYLGKQIEHLLMSVKRLLNKVDVYFGLTTTGHTVKQYHLLLQELKLYLVEGFLLYGIQLFDALRMRFTTKWQTRFLFFSSSFFMPLGRAAFITMPMGDM